MAQRRFGAGRGGNADFCRLYGGRRYAGVRTRARQPADGDAPAQHPQRLRSPDVHERLRQVVQSLLRLFRYDQERHLRHTQGRVHDPVFVGVDLRPQELVRLPADLRFAATAPERLLVCGRHAPAAALRRLPDSQQRLFEGQRRQRRRHDRYDLLHEFQSRGGGLRRRERPAVHLHLPRRADDGARHDGRHAGADGGGAGLRQGADDAGGQIQERLDGLYQRFAVGELLLRPGHSAARFQRHHGRDLRHHACRVGHDALRA